MAEEKRVDAEQREGEEEVLSTGPGSFRTESRPTNPDCCGALSTVPKDVVGETEEKEDETGGDKEGDEHEV